MGAVNDRETILDVIVGTGRINDFTDKIIGIFLLAGEETEIFEEEDVAFFHGFDGMFNIWPRDVVDEMDVW